MAIDRADVGIIAADGAGYPAAFLLDAAGRSVVLVDPVGNPGGRSGLPSTKCYTDAPVTPTSTSTTTPHGAHIGTSSAARHERR